MSSIGEFREGEIDGKSFLICTLLDKPDNPSSSSNETTIVSGGNNIELLQPLVICPRLRWEAAWIKQDENRKSGGVFTEQISTSFHFPTTQGGDQQVQDLLDSDSHQYKKTTSGDICKLPLVPLFWCNNQDSAACRICGLPYRGTTYYFCVTCGNQYHKECVETPLEIKYPSYPFHSFHLTHFFGLPHFSDRLTCICCNKYVSLTIYHCPTSNLGMHTICAKKPIPMVIDYPKRHPHPLTFFPKQAFLPCNVCGLIKEFIPTYLCVRCVFVVHQDCVYFPNVIKISRHHHRISLTSFLPPGEWSCGVCRKEVDNHYSAYSCNKCDGYFVHTRCALRKDLWDGVDLEGVPEELEIVIEPFKRIAEGIILHFSHDHLLKLEINRVYDEEKFCSACILPIIFEDEFYSCMDHCDFILHKACANAPCRKHHPLHAHSLTLKVFTNSDVDKQGYFRCTVCRRLSCGFVYESDQGSQAFRLDLTCALVSEPFEYQGHEAPLFLALTPEEEKSVLCQICKYQNSKARKLNCLKCDYVICFKCATLPYKARYKYDKHLLTFRKEKEARDESGWCELCEKEIVYSSEDGFYSCDDYCGTTLHVDCLLGKNMYMRHGQTMMSFGKEVHTLRNNTMSRPFCHAKFSIFCGTRRGRCPHRVVFKRENQTFCSFMCLYYS